MVMEEFQSTITIPPGPGWLCTSGLCRGSFATDAFGCLSLENPCAAGSLSPVVLGAAGWDAGQGELRSLQTWLALGR